MKKQYTLMLTLILMISVSIAQTWQPVGPDDNSWPSLNSARFTSIAIDPSGIPYVVFSDVGNSDKATVKKFSAGSWTDVGIPGFSAGGAENTSIAIDGSGTPYVVYSDISNSSKATVKKFSAGVWTDVGTSGFSTGQAGFFFSTSIAIDGSGTGYVVYRDDANSGKATVKKFS